MCLSFCHYLGHILLPSCHSGGKKGLEIGPLPRGNTFLIWETDGCQLSHREEMLLGLKQSSPGLGCRTRHRESGILTPTFLSELHFNKYNCRAENLSNWVCSIGRFACNRLSLMRSVSPTAFFPTSRFLFIVSIQSQTSSSECVA